jgi:cellulose synthase/poly-beta-1,6-N-acetylglucosamine synthase-like glycosyltransferase
VSVLTSVVLGSTVLCCLAWAVLFAVFLKAWKERVELTSAPGELPPGSAWPKVSVIVPSRDEAAAVEGATLSLLAQDYPALEVVAVDDRSADGTGAILDRLALSDPRLTVVHVKDLPAGWLGKNHANHLGAKRAGGELFLFTDGDVIFSPSAIRLAVALLLRHGLGHLVVVPHMLSGGFLERAYDGICALIISVKFRIWELKRAGTAAYIGVGAFNLVRRDDYLRIGGHGKLAFEVADDSKLGMMLRRSGVPQGACDSCGLVRVRWQTGFFATVGGLVKNSFAVFEFRWERAVGGALFMSWLTAWPVVALAVGPGLWLRLAALAPLGLSLFLLVAVTRRFAGGSGAEALLLTLLGPVLGFTFIFSAAVATARGGILWRGTHYPLVLLRQGCVRERDWPASGSVGWR